MAYKKGIPLTGGLYPMDNGDFPLVEAADVYVDDNSRLSDKLSEQDAAISAKYVKPASGIPTSDLAESVQDSLDAAARVVNEVSGLKSALINGVFDDDLSKFANLSGFIESDGVTINSNLNYCHSEPIEIPFGAKSIRIGTYFKIGNTVYHLQNCLFFFDESDALISSVSGNIERYEIVNIPPNAKYVRFNRVADDTFVSVARGFWFLYGSSEKCLEDSIQFSFNGDLSSLASEPYLINSDETLGNSLSYSHSEFIAIPKDANKVNIGVRFTLDSTSYYLNPCVFFYDDTYTLISYDGGVEKDFANYDIPLSAKYVKFNQVVGGGNISSFTHGFWFSPSYIERINNIVSGTETYIVDINGENRSLTAMLLSLKDNDNQKTVIVRGGDYNIFNEYKELQQAGLIPAIPVGEDPILKFVDYSVFVPKNTHIIGEGYVRLIYMPAESDTYEAESKALSPLNVADSCTIENVEIHCKNGRYCIHDEVLQNGAYIGAKHIYKNVKMIKYINDSTFGTLHAFGCGIGREMYFEFDNCFIENKNTDTGARGLYFHNRKVVDGVTLTARMSSNIVVKNCIVLSASQNLAFFLGSIGSGNSFKVQIRVNVDSCYFNGNIVEADEGNWESGSNRNTFLFTILNSKYTNLIIRDENNSYPPIVCNFN